ncbi:MAG: HD domain-containing phosphohydrolase, partial [Thermodesulfovibrionales bacterium]|nr:HD domain-containing phosphohydrolase [Thermodesulfovibrionales bacterium]
GSEHLVGFSMPKSKGIAGWVVDNAAAVRVNDARDDKRFYPHIDKLTGYETKSVLCVPLIMGSAVIGALELVSGRGNAFSGEDEEIISYFAGQAAISIERARFYEDEKNYEIHLTNILSNVNDKIAEKRGHSKRIAKYALLMADGLGMPDEGKKRLYTASLLHDIGFLNIRLSDVTTADGYKAHSHLGYEMLLPINFYDGIAPIVLHHHERYDGMGYPSGLGGESIPVESRIIAIAEAFDAMVSRDSYKNSGRIISRDINPETVDYGSAIEELRRNAGTQFDPALVEVFTKNITEEHLE